MSEQGGGPEKPKWYRTKLSFIDSIVYGVLIVFSLIVAIVFIPEILPVFQFVWEILFGWIYFISDKLPKVRPNLGIALVAVMALCVFFVLSHSTLRWLYKALASDDVETPRTWHVRWTLAVLTIFFLVFIAGISLTSIIHQSYWLATSPLPIVEAGRDYRSRRSIESSARAAEFEVKVALDAYLAHEPQLFLKDGSIQFCAEAAGAIGNKTCQSVYSMPAEIKYSSVSDIRDLIVDHHSKGKQEQNPIDGTALFVRGGDDAQPIAGQIVLSVIDDRTLGIKAYGDVRGEAVMLINSTVSGNSGQRK